MTSFSRVRSPWRPFFFLSCLVLLLPVLACSDDDDDDGGSGGENVGPVDVLGIWGAEELESFEAMVGPWESERGGQVNFTGTRNITADLTLRVDGGNPPDIAIPAEIGLFQEFARDGKLTPLNACEGLEDLVRDNYPEAFIDLGTVDGELYGFFMKADTKGTIWYNPRFFEEHDLEPLDADASWDDLIALSEAIHATGTPPWSIGVESAEASGWPGTDWIQQIILNQESPELYDGLVDGSIPFTDPRVKASWEKFGQIATTDGWVSQGGTTGINATGFQESAYPPFQDPPAAGMVALGGFAGGFITDQFPDIEPGEGFNFFPWPGGNVTGAANVVYAFNSEPATCSFLEYLAGDESQRIWVDRGGFTSVNTEVDLDSYPNDVARAQAEQLTEAESFRFDLDDAIGGALQQAFFQGVTEFLANPGQLDSILQAIEGARE